MWCVRVASGAFVACRNGKMFITGNSGFPKSLDVSKAIDKMKGLKREVVGPGRKHGGRAFGKGCGDPVYSGGIFGGGIPPITAPASNEAKLWNGWGTALKPAYEPIIVAMKPLDGTYAENALKWGVAGLAIDSCRISTSGKDREKHLAEWNRVQSKGAKGNISGGYGLKDMHLIGYAKEGRWPANLALNESAAKLLDAQTGIKKSGGRKGSPAEVNGGYFRKQKETGKPCGEIYSDAGGASRFFYCAKASRRERGDFNNHPTLKPLALIRWLCLLTKTPTGGVVLDPFMGSGTTGVACLETGRRFIGVEKEKAYFKIARRRIQESL